MYFQIGEVDKMIGILITYIVYQLALTQLKIIVEEEQQMHYNSELVL